MFMADANSAIKKDCILYDEEKKVCRALTALYCQKEKCGFYKSESEYDSKGYRLRNKH